MKQSSQILSYRVIKKASKKLFLSVESRRGAVSYARPVSPPRSSNRTCGFPASGFPTGFMTGSRRGVRIAAQMRVQHTECAEHHASADMPAAVRRQLVAPDEKASHVVMQMRHDHSVGGVVGPRAEVAAPSPQQAVQRAAHLIPCAHVPRYEDCAHLVLQTLHALLRRTGPRVPSAGLPEAVRAEAVTQEVEPFLPCIAQAGFRPVPAQPKTCHHAIRPRHGLGRMSTAENDEVVRIVDDMRLPSLAPAALTPVFQEAVHVEVGDQRTDNATLGGATLT